MLVTGEVDLAVVPDLLEQGQQHLRSRPSVLEIDLGGVSFIDSSGLGALVHLRNDATSAGVTLILSRPTAAVRRLLQVSGLDQVFEIRSED